jgi:glycerate-2-kinase
MIRWLLLAALAFLIIAALQGIMASRREKKPVEGNDILPALPPLPDATELEKSRRELEALEQRLDIPNPGQQGKGV